MPHTVGDVVESFHFVCLFVCLCLCFGFKEGRKRQKVTEDWRKMHSEELHRLCFSPNIIRLIKSRRMRWAGNVARLGERRGAVLCSEHLKEGDHLKEVVVDGRIMLEWLLKE
jgi:hypothetical protein